jgi:hypothetical protein
VNGDHAGRFEFSLQLDTPAGAPAELAQVKRAQRRHLDAACSHLPRDVFLTFDVFFAAGFAAGFSGVPAASALSFCFLVAIPDHDFPNSRFQNGTAFVSLAGVVTAAGTSAAAFGSTLGVSVMVTPSILRTSRLDGDVNQTITTGLNATRPHTPYRGVLEV